MNAQDFTVIPLKPQLQFQQLMMMLSRYMGLVFLQDTSYPVIGFLPKKLYDFSSESMLQRTADSGYQSTPQSFDIDQFKISSPVQKGKDQVQFQGGYIGFFSYDYAVQQHVETHSSFQPAALIGEYDIFLKQIKGIWQLYIEKNLINLSHIRKIIGQLTQFEQTPSIPENLLLDQPLQARWSKSEYKAAFKRVQDYLYAGDCYQINLTQEFSTKVTSGQLLSLLPDLLELTQAPFAGYLRFQDFELLSCSPELFIEFQADGVLKTRPIKGTLPRHSNPEIDQQLKQQLSHSEKDQAENLMIVDLLRNDLSVYAETGSVKVPHLFEIESFAQVHHMVSEIQATLKADVNLFEVLLAALPGGSITGAPKIRAMQIIEELEGHARGAYCGSLGYFNYDGTGRFNILIRSIQRYGDDLSIWAGGGITVASEVDAEYQECLDKVSALLNFLNRYSNQLNTHCL